MSVYPAATAGASPSHVVLFGGTGGIFGSGEEGEVNALNIATEV
jgi:hypothetical protein